MTMYLVVLRYLMHDIPLLLTPSEAEAMEAAKNYKPGDDEYAKALLKIDADEPICTNVWVFAGNRMTEVRRVQDFT